MTDDAVETFVEAILGDQPPKEFSAASEDADILRVAIALRAGQTLFAGPDPEFIEDLHRQLAATARRGTSLLPLPTIGQRRGKTKTEDEIRGSRLNPRPFVRRRFAALSKAAAAALLVAGTFTATNLLGGGHSPLPVARDAATATSVRSGELLSADGRLLGRTFAFAANPSWIFMDIQSSGLGGAYTCELQLTNGTTIPAGIVAVYNGSSDWAHSVKIDLSQLQRATLVTSTGATVASTTFS